MIMLTSVTSKLRAKSGVILCHRRDGPGHLLLALALPPSLCQLLLAPGPGHLLLGQGRGQGGGGQEQEGGEEGHGQVCINLKYQWFIVHSRDI